LLVAVVEVNVFVFLLLDGAVVAVVVVQTAGWAWYCGNSGCGAALTGLGME
jgi:hypothetical protein